MNFPFKPTYKALFVIHGEGDGNISNTAYDKNLIEWLNDFTADIKAITGQEEQPVMLTCQTSSAAGYKGTAEGRHQFITPFLQLKASEEHPRIFLVCPKYQFNYKDYAHILAPDTKYLGEYYAKVKKIVVDEGGDWLGLRPKTLTKVDARTVDIEFHVPVASLVLDEEQVVNPGNYGFALYNSGTASIHSVKLLANPIKTKYVSPQPRISRPEPRLRMLLTTALAVRAAERRVLAVICGILIRQFLQTANLNYMTGLLLSSCPSIRSKLWDNLFV